jgi:tetratricopeptide (TPR) repeat protein
MTRGERLIALVGALVLALALGPVSAHAEDAEAGRRQFKRGQELLKVGDYRAAAKAFEAGYAAAPRVGFLLNIGNCYRKLGELSKARAYYWRFLDAAPKDHPSRPAVMDYLRAMEQIEADGVSVDSSSAAPPAAAAASAEIAVPDEVGDPVAAAPVAKAPNLSVRPPVEPAGGLATVEVRKAPREERPIYKRWWFWTLVGGAVAAGAATYVLTRPAGCGASLGCANEL